MSVEQQHEEKETLTVEVEIPGHDPRVTTELFRKSKLALIARDGARCYICGRTAEESGHPLEAHHYPVERSLATAWDWPRFIRDCKAGAWGPHAQAFDWDSFDPARPYSFVDDQTVNGMLLCKEDHTGADTGIHALPFPLWIWRKYAPEGYEIRPGEHLKHEFPA